MKLNSCKYMAIYVMSNSWITSIEKLMLWRAGSWHKYDTKINSWTLQIIGDILLISTDTRVVETLSLHSKIKGIHKGDILILIISGAEVRKIKFQIKGNVNHCFRMLSQWFPIVNYNVTISDKTFESRYRNVEEVIRCAVEAKDKAEFPPLPMDYKNFVKLCLLDPNMPQVIRETQTIVEDLCKLGLK